MELDQLHYGGCVLPPNLYTLSFEQLIHIHNTIQTENSAIVTRFLNTSFFSNLPDNDIDIDVLLDLTHHNLFHTEIHNEILPRINILDLILYLKPLIQNISTHVFLKEVSYVILSFILKSIKTLGYDKLNLTYEDKLYIDRVYISVLIFMLKRFISVELCPIMEQLEYDNAIIETFRKDARCILPY